MNLVFIGAGKMATAIASGIRRNEDLAQQLTINAVDPFKKAADAFSSATGYDCFAVAEPSLLQQCDVVVLAVKPQNAESVSLDIAKLLDGQLIISIAAGLKVQTMANWYKTNRIVRLMPNTPLLVAKGASAYSCGQGVFERDEDLVVKIFQSMGVLHKVSENLMDAVTALSGSGPAYIFEMIQAMREGAVELGLDEKVALDLTVQTVAGAAEMLQQGMGDPEDLRRAVTSPGGTTEAGLSVLGKNKFRSLISEVLRAACDRSIELGKK